MCVMVNDTPRSRINSVQTAASSQPQSPGPVLDDVMDMGSNTVRIAAFQAIMTEAFGRWIESLKEPTTSDPEHVGTIFEDSTNISATNSVRAFRVRRKYLEVIAIVSIQAKLCTEPHEPLIVLCNLLAPGL